MKTLLSLILISAFTISYGQNTDLTISKSGNGKQAIILLSGLGCKNEIWNETANSLSKNATIYAIDYYTDSNNALASIDRISNQILDWISRKKLKNITLIGHSLGGALALKVAANSPNLFNRLIIIDSYPSISALSNPNFVSNTSNDCSPWVTKFTSMSDDQFKAFQTANIAQMAHNSEGQKLVLDWATHFDRSHYALLLCDYLNTDLREKIKSINCHTLILASSGMKQLGSNIEDQYKSIKQHKIVYSEAGLHFLMFDDFDWYITNIENFIK